MTSRGLGFETRDLEDSGIVADLAIAGYLGLDAPIVERSGKFYGPEDLFVFGQVDTAMIDCIIKGSIP